MKTLANLYLKCAHWASSLKSPFLLAIRLYWGWQLIQSGWGKLHHLDRVTDFFSSLNLPAPGVTAHFISSLELIGGIALVLGIAMRFFGLVLTVNMLAAYWTADRDALTAFFSDPGKFYNADPYTFLFAALMVLIFGAGFFSIDALLEKQFRKHLDITDEP